MNAVDNISGEGAKEAVECHYRRSVIASAAKQSRGLDCRVAFGSSQ